MDLLTSRGVGGSSLSVWWFSVGGSKSGDFLDGFPFVDPGELGLALFGIVVDVARFGTELVWELP